MSHHDTHGNRGLSRSAKRVEDALLQAGLSPDVQELPASTRTAVEAADAVGCDVGQIAKSLIFRGRTSGRPYLVITSGANRVDLAMVGDLVGEPLEMADPDYVREHTGFSIGGVPPLGHKQPLEILIDADLLEHDAIWAAAGTPHAVFRLTPNDLLRIAGNRVTRVTG